MGTTFRSYCKINLGLEIIRRRPDGYHDINTVFYRLNSPFDELVVESADSYSLIVEGSDLAEDDTNLVTRAFQACAATTHLPMPGLSVVLKKQVPFGAGLGGGSADAAKAIQIYSELVSPLSAEQMQLIGRSLGADVPFFLQRERAALASGIGDVLIPTILELPYAILVVKPKDISIPTSQAYARLHLGAERRSTDLLKVLHTPIETWQSSIRNEFEPIAFEMAGALRKLKARLLSLGADFALMSGSGSAFFALFHSSQKAREAFKSVSSDGSLECFFDENGL